MINILMDTIYYFNLFVIIYFFLINFRQIIFLAIGFKNIIYQFQKFITGEERIIASGENVPPISIILPAYNEEDVILESIKHLRNLNYPEYEIVIVNDGSTDCTLEKLISKYNMRLSDVPYKKELDTASIKGIYKSFDYPKLTVIDKINGGKGDSLNCGINMAYFPLVAVVDADSVLESNSLIHLAKPFIQDDRVIAVGGTVRVLNGNQVQDGVVKNPSLPKAKLVLYQIIEYFRAFLSERVVWDKFNTTMIISGTFGLFRKDMIIKAGGYLTDTIGEDMELVLRLHKTAVEMNLDYKIEYTPAPVCWTQAPENLKSLKSQRKRWHQGLMESLFKHKDMLFNSDYGKLGNLMLPMTWLFELFSPVIEIMGYFIVILSLITGILSNTFILFFILALLYGTLFSITSILMDVVSFNRYKGPLKIGKLIIYSIIENFWYRPLVNYYRFKGIIDYLNDNSEWGMIDRQSLDGR